MTWKAGRFVHKVTTHACMAVSHTKEGSWWMEWGMLGKLGQQEEGVKHEAGEGGVSVCLRASEVVEGGYRKSAISSRRSAAMPWGMRFSWKSLLMMSPAKMN